MCTVSFIPQPNGGYVFTSNRDETPLRPATPPIANKQANGVWYGPLDQGSGGTWFGTNLKISACVLNGAFEKHEHRPPYKRSRGLLIPALMQASSLKEFLTSFDFEGMEPFTLIVIEQQLHSSNLHEIRWDATHTHEKQLSTKFPIWWQSATLYNAEQAALRSVWFKDWLDKQSELPSQDAIITFHKTAGDAGPELNLVMNRIKVRTTSITSLKYAPSHAQMKYFDVLAEKEYELTIL